MKADLPVFNRGNTAVVSGTHGRLFLARADDDRIESFGLVCFVPDEIFVKERFDESAYLASYWALLVPKAWGESSAHHAFPDISRPEPTNSLKSRNFLRKLGIFAARH